MGKSAEPAFAQYIENIFLGPSLPDVIDPVGGLLLKQSGHIDVPVFLRAVCTHLRKADSYRDEKLQPEHLEVTENKVRYGDYGASGVIFCGGMQVSNNHYFSWLPINPLKGETIQLKMSPVPYIINRGVYVVPGKEKGEFAVGATYDFQSISPEITTRGRQELEMKLKELVNLPYSVIAQNWGIRPTSLDQKIIMGPHPRWRNLLIFNGLGTKGVSLAPYFSAQLAGWLEGENEILPEVNIRRYNALYSKL
jgi:glycine oxidase